MTESLSVGDTPGPRIYRCRDCKWEIRLHTDQESLPKCGLCEKEQETRYEPVERGRSAHTDRQQDAE